ncbi:MAG: ABC transporter ATP-binding protein/permease [Sphaerochaetaceae bacterium]|nr:ABC transporter ATP-binding protein/permease [Sphaerochaetaceae bacterium]
MLQVSNLVKRYTVGDNVQTALDGVSLNLRDNEFVAILGPSGSGKTTLLNMIGGLDRYDDGDIIINGISTKKYNDRDWDSYRNHTIGFVFQSYNLIPHQSVLANVELALTISGISKAERRKRAKQALIEVGLEQHMTKRPNQLSGGQMQRVAIARALVNNPDILLADEPTGALDSETSVQVMNLLKEVAQNRLVVMVTHNPELAQQYATRIVLLKDGKIIDDSDPFEAQVAEDASKGKKVTMGKSSMSFRTALSLSFNNLKTKKGRTLLTAFAGSIGIIGIALILSLSTGVNRYIDDIQRSTMSSYPITIDAETYDLSAMVGAHENMTERGHELDGVYSNTRVLEMASTMVTSTKENNLSKFKAYLDDPESDIRQYLGENGVVYTYNVSYNVYTYDPTGAFVTAKGGRSGSAGRTMMSSNPFSEMLAGKDDNIISSVVKDNYDLVYGSWPTSYDEIVAVVDHNNEISALTMYQCGLLPYAEYRTIMLNLQMGQSVEVETSRLSFEDICNHTMYLMTVGDMYALGEDGLYKNVSSQSSEIEKILSNALELKVVGVIRANEDATYTGINGAFAYTKALKDYMIRHNAESAVMKAQVASPETSVITGAAFEFGEYEETINTLGHIDVNSPSSISIYTDSFEAKESVSDCIKQYNRSVEKADRITYTDYVALLMSSVTTIVNVISYVLIAFVSVSLVVSSIMIGIITYISVLERTKEIGILRAIGASKHNISQVFNAETFIIGLFSGAIGIGITEALLVPINAIIHVVAESKGVNAVLPIKSAIILVVLSVLLTLIGGLIPSRKAAKKDPVTALRTE